jgi:hypothetical protein
VVLVRGLFGAWIPRHFRAPLQQLRERGWDATIARTDPAGTIEDNAKLLVPQFEAIAAAGKHPIVLAHSKGGLEALLALCERPALARSVAGFVGVQMPRAGAPYLESVFCGAHRASRTRGDVWREGRDHTLLRLLGARAACAELNGECVAPLAERIDAAALPFPWLTVASHASRATPTLEMRHARLARIRPGALHDGVFYLDQQHWPRSRQLVLSGLDHAQPSVGGLGFDHGRFWCDLLDEVAFGESAA